MKRVVMFATLSMILAATAAAQTPPPTPPETPPPAAPVAPLAPAPHPFGEWSAPSAELHWFDYSDALVAPGWDLHISPFAHGLVWDAWDLAYQEGSPFQTSRTTTFAPRDSAAAAYKSAMTALSRRDYATAVARFDRVIAQQKERVDAALHWKAFAQYRLGEAQAALESLTVLRRNHPQSRYLTDAKVLEADVRSAQGQVVNVATIDDDDIKILAIQGLQRSNPEGTVPLLEGVLTATNSPLVKARALYVLALSEAPRAHEILVGYAKGDGNPDLQLQAISYVATRRNSQTTSSDLREIYEATDDEVVRLAIIGAYRSAGDKDSLLTLVSDYASPIALRSRAVGNLSSLAAPEELWALYQKESSAELRAHMVSALASMRAFTHLMQAVEAERDGEVRRSAILALGHGTVEDAGPVLEAAYAAHDDDATRKAVIASLAKQDNADALVSIARKEKSVALTKEIVSRLSAMAARSKVASDYLMEIIRR